MVHLTMSDALPDVALACAAQAMAAHPARRAPCIAIGRILLHEGRTLLAARFGEGVLRKLDALQGSDAERARRIAWWQATRASMTDSRADDAYLADWLSTGNELEALRLGATRAGKTEPPADWKPTQRSR